MAAEAHAPAHVEKPEEEHKPAIVEVEKKVEVVEVVTVETAAVEVAEEPKKAEDDDPKKEEDPKKAPEEPVDPEKKALEELKQLLAAAVANKEFSKKKKKKKAEEEKKVEEEKKAEAAVEEEKKEEEKKEEVEEEKKEKVEEEKKEKVEEEEEKKVEEPCKEDAEEKKVEEPSKKLEELIKSEEGEEKHEEEAKKEGEEEAKKEAAEEVVEEEEEEEEEVKLWGVSLLEGGEKAEGILVKFLRARELKAKDALSMIKNTVAWRREFGADGLAGEDLGMAELEKAVFMHGADRAGHPVCYNVSGALEDRELFQKAFGDEERRRKFLRWRVQLLERGITELLDFGPGGVSSMVQVNDLKGARWLWGKEIRHATWNAINLLQNNYPEFVAHQVFINVPWWYLAYNRMASTFINQATRSKFIFAGPSRSPEILFKYVAPEQVPVQFGGLSKENNPDFSTADPVTDVAIKPSSKHTVEIPVSEACVLVWEFRVLGSDVSYAAEFVPSAEDGYTVIVQKSRKLTHADEPVERGSYKIGEPGKIVLCFDNAGSKKKKLLYRHKTKSSHE